MSDTKNISDIQNHIIFLGNRNDVDRLYNAMDVFVLPSRYEGLPVVGVEAQANGLPCLLSDKMTKEAKMTDIAYFFSIESSPENWAKKICRFFGVKRKNTSKKISKCGFDIDKESKSLENYYINKYSGEK